MKIESLNIEYSGEKIITDIDDCIFFTTKSIKAHKLTRRGFWLDPEIYDKNKNSVFEKAELTAWGKELLFLIKNLSLTLSKVEFITAAYDRTEILKEKFLLLNLNIQEGLVDSEKTKYLNTINDPVIYVDDKTTVINNLRNSNIKSVLFPARTIRLSTRTPRKYKTNRRNF